MNISRFQQINEARAKLWHNDGQTDWTLLEWAGAMCGESGEAANVAKKIRRLDMSLPNKEAGLEMSNLEILKAKMAQEVADSIIYGLICLSKLEVDVAIILEEVFNTKSKEYGFPHRALD